LYQNKSLVVGHRNKASELRQLPGGALHLLGVIALQTRQTERGVELIQKAIGLNSNVAEAHNSLGTALKDLKRLVEALASYDKAIALKPDYQRRTTIAVIR
jgi:protein O-GlcNAc transferase